MKRMLFRVGPLAHGCIVASMTLCVLLASQALAYGLTKEVLVVPMQRPLPNSPGYQACSWYSNDSGYPEQPRNSAAEWQTLLNEQVTPYYQTESYDTLTWQFNVVVNPQSQNGWWPAQQCPNYSGGNYDAGNIAGDAAQRVLGTAYSLGLITYFDIINTHNFIMLDNFHTQHGQTDSAIHTYQIPLPFPFLAGALTTKVTVISENADDSSAIGVFRHELGNQLGLPELYTAPCPLVEPGGYPPLDDCVGTWDVAALNENGFGAYERMLAGWLTLNSTKWEEQSWSGVVNLSPLEQPNGDTLALILSTQPLLRPDDAQAPSPGPGTWEGYIVECRRKIGDDAELPSSGVLVTYFDSTPGGKVPALVVRRSPGLSVSSAGMQPGDTYSNKTLGVQVMYAGDAPNGSCRVAVHPHYPPGHIEPIPPQGR